MYTHEDLQKMQAWPLERKIRVTQTRILEFIVRLGQHVYVSFSGGKDSTVLLDLARRVQPDIPAVFSDTGLEFNQIREFVKTVDNVEIIRPKKRFDRVIKEFGYPVVGKSQARFIRDLQTAGDHNKATCHLRLTGYNRQGIYCPSMKLADKWVYLKDAPFKISEQCCDVMKKEPLKSYGKRTGRHPIMATMTEESSMRERSWIRNGCNVFDGKEIVSRPMSFWTEQDVLRYLKETNIPYCSIYGDIVEGEDGLLHTTGEHRTGCVYCGFGAHLESEPNRYQRLRVIDPKKYEYCMKDVECGGLGFDKVLTYMNIPH